jgi:plastocyanin
MTIRRIFAMLALAPLAAACGAASETTLAPSDPGSPPAAVSESPSAGVSRDEAGPEDPRRGGLDVGLGEWAVTPEAPAIRPGQVTFVIANRGTLVHGFEIEREDGGDFKAESELLQPGETARITVNLVPGLYKVECKVDGHDDLGMETMLEVRADAPLAAGGTGGGSDASEVAIQGFAYQPPTISVQSGTQVTWTNADPTEHTVSAEDGSFSSDPLGSGTQFSTTFDQPGTYAYLCAIHPDMRGSVEVTSG